MQFYKSNTCLQYFLHYRQEKLKIGPTGGTPSVWEHFQKVHNILGSFKLHNIQENMHESTGK